MRPRVDEDIQELMVRYRPIIAFRVRKALGAQNTDCEDLVSEILSQVLEKLQLGEFRGESSLGTFVYTITSRRIVDYIREKTKVMKYAPEPAPFPDPQETLEVAEMSDKVKKALSRLKPKYREVLYLYYYQELSREEVAERLKVSTRKVSELVNYALKLIRKELKP
ncbi:MAG: sigma-70 family RNA polymerase sigma factor [Candidatus Saccharicenans sp.]|nr:sigma-70 family RNA polymerase sigma factor [Candidatus Saccharicenans sp.]MDI6848441.1 sigma-70 family RNA polymerase sigma factor [Candidatus Saccharicenans sp.]